MGDPKKQRKKYETPRYPYSHTTLDSESKLLGEYGLRNKRELWRHHFMVSKYRTIARELLSKTPKERAKIEKLLLDKLFSLKIIPEMATLDNVLDLSIESILQRRLQTLILRKGLSKTPQQARQLITHGHISIKNKKITSPSYIVTSNEEQFIEYSSSSPLSRTDHPLKKEITT